MTRKQELENDKDIPPDQRSLYYQIIRCEYENIKSLCHHYWVTKSGNTIFDEDIFHDTIFNSTPACRKMSVKNEIYKYICRAYYYNRIRESKYSRNLLSLMRYNQFSPSDLITCKENNFESFKREVFEFVKKDKGERVANIIFDYIDGYTYEELVVKYNIKNIYKKVRPLKMYMKKIIQNWDRL